MSRLQTLPATLFTSPPNSTATPSTTMQSPQQAPLQEVSGLNFFLTHSHFPLLPTLSSLPSCLRHCCMFAHHPTCMLSLPDKLPCPHCLAAWSVPPALSCISLSQPIACLSSS